MKALVYKQPGRANAGIEDVPYPLCGPDQVIMKIMACGICKPAESSHDRNGSVLGEYPCIPGHEFAGEVVEVGRDVTAIQVGERITADNGVPCGTCYYCQMGKPAFCEHFGSMGHNLPGGMAQYIAINESKVYKIPQGIPYKHACLCELIGCCIHCVDRCNIKFDDTVAVLGAGSSGLILSQLLLHSGASKVVVLDSIKSKLDRIAKKGAEVFQVDRSDYSIHEKALLAEYPRGMDIMIDTTGCAELINRSIGLLKSGGKFVGYSFPTGPERRVAIDMAQFIIKELTYIGSTFQTFDFNRCLDVLANGIVDCDLLITDEYPIDRYFEALDKNLSDNESIKIVIHPN